jgi:hypothetical protein
MEWQSVTGTPTIETTIVRANGTAYRIAPGATKQVQHSSYSSGQGLKYYRIYFHVVTAPASNNRVFISLDNSSAIKIGVRLNTNMTMQFFNEEDIAQIGSTSSALSTGKFYRLEMGINDTTLASTACEIRLYDASAESTLIWNETGTINLAAAPNRLSIKNGNDTNLDFVFTDVAIIEGDSTAPNTWAGEGSIIYLRPSGAGTSTQWSRGGTDSGANWSQTSETPPNDVTSYVESNTVNQVDDFALADTPSAIATNDLVRWIASGARFALSSTTGPDPDFVSRITIGGNTVESANISGAGDTLWASYKGNTNLVFPQVLTGSYTKSDLDSAQIGIRETNSDTHFIRVSALWLMFEFCPTPTVSLSSPTDASTTSDDTPDLVFTGTHSGGQEIEYEVQLDTVNSFDSVAGGDAQTLVDSVSFPSVYGGTAASSETSQAQSQVITPASSLSLTSIDLKLYKLGSPTDNLSISVHSTSETGTTLGTSASISGASITTDQAGEVKNFTFSPPISLSAGVSYYLVVERSGARDTVNLYSIRAYGTSDAYAGGTARVRSSNLWSNRSPAVDWYFVLYPQSQPLLDKLSTADPGFSGTGDPHPWPSGNAVTYTVQSSLADGTYYWRVRGTDPLGSNAWGGWSSTFSFTVNTGAGPTGQPFRIRALGIPTGRMDRPRSWN